MSETICTVMCISDRRSSRRGQTYVCEELVPGPSCVCLVALLINNFLDAVRQLPAEALNFKIIVDVELELPKQTNTLDAHGI